MRSHIRLGRVFGVEIGLHYSWLLIALLIAFSLAENFELNHSEWPPAVIWAAAILTALLFFVSLVAHELSHSLVAKARGLPVRAITLFALGGVAQIEREAADAKTEFWMAIVGPISSALIGLGCLAGAWAFGWQFMGVPDTPLLSILVWLGYINISLAAFNMIPGFPLDGGRVLRAIVWWITGNATRAMRVAAQVGRVVALLFILWGVFRFTVGAGFGALWIALIGWFLLDAAGSSYAQVKVSEMLRGLRVRDLMMRDCPNVELRANLREFIENQLLRTGRPCFIVTDAGREVGLVTAGDVRGIPRPQWPYKTISDVMRPLDEVETISPETPITEALETMGRHNVSQLPVTLDGHLEGIISRAAVLGFLQTRSQLRI